MGLRRCTSEAAYEVAQKSTSVAGTSVAGTSEAGTGEAGTSVQAQQVLSTATPRNYIKASPPKPSTC
jgi:hypothetical protein